jgi:hypothetical protein
MLTENVDVVPADREAVPAYLEAVAALVLSPPP